jgi:hypothetical protein
MIQIEDFMEDTERNNRIVQRALREIDTEVLSDALADLPERIREIIYRNMSQRARSVLAEDIKGKKGIHPKQIQAAREIWIQLLNKHTKYVAAEGAAPAKEEIPPVRMDAPEQIIATFRALASYVRSHGFLPLEAAEQDIPHPLMRKGVEFLVDGLDPLYMRSILEKYKATYLRVEETRLEMILDGLESLASRDFPHVVEQKLRAHVPQA